MAAVVMNLRILMDGKGINKCSVRDTGFSSHT